MKVKIKLKDTTTPVYYENVMSHFVEGPTLALLFEDGSVRNFPMIHIWYYETCQPREKTRVPEDSEKSSGNYTSNGSIMTVPFAEAVNAVEEKINQENEALGEFCSQSVNLINKWIEDHKWLRDHTNVSITDLDQSNAKISAYEEVLRNIFKVDI